MSRSRHLGKIRKRLEDVKSQWVRPARADFSDNESARLATDALLDGGPEAYWRVLSQEGEVDFLSSVEAQYIQAQAWERPCPPDTLGGAETGPKGLDSSSLQSGTYFPVASEGSEPALLHSWASAEKPYLKEKSSATVYFQTDKHNNIRDLIRRCITRTSQNISIRSVEGEVYCAKSGRKFAGQIREKFIISDWRFVLSGSYSFTWLCGHVHRNILSKFTGQAVEPFDEEFRHLYASSKPVMGLKSPRLVAPVPTGAAPANGRLSSSSGSASDCTSSNPFSGLSAGSHPRTRSVSASSGPGSPAAPHPPPPPRFQPHHGPWGTPSPQAHFSPRPHDGLPAAVYSNLGAYRPTRLQLEQLGLVPRLTPTWRPFLQASPHF
ncbi:PREDICTED: protein FAM83A isoform X2 [Colobus angolensis palliatus]|uniref:protein FAM83A isoform X2 n=1 Tax=Colobus angolensis palliatus TaxID=336983 RepID=UPI0005F4A207|nr:PREDICTED: protein FAM83A isoform X2 [Colobus angolensis palliatus]